MKTSAMLRALTRFGSVGLVLGMVGACGTDAQREGFGGDASGADPSSGGSSSSSSSGGFNQVDSGATGADAAGIEREPETCEEARQARSYIGCDYWPTVTANLVPALFDYAVVVANTGKTAADVTVTGPNNVNTKVSVAAGALEKIYLPWVPELKGGEDDYFLGIPVMSQSVFATKGAYHLVSSAPVIVSQFNALEYKGGSGGPPGKNWGNCHSDNCFSYTNDASLLLPSTAWTTSYRITGVPGWTRTPPDENHPDPNVLGGYVVVTAAEDGTTLSLALGANGSVLAGPGIDTGKPGSVSVTLNAGDAVELVGPPGAAYDLSGSLLTSNKPVQVITGIACTNVPGDNPACDHVEESVMPAEALGKKYVVTTPTRPSGGPGLHVVRFYGNRDGTTLTYSPGKPADCPDTLSAGQVASCGPLGEDFVVESASEFGISTLQVSASVYTGSVDNNAPGDPAQSIFASLEQFRDKYVFLAPNDYDTSYAVVVGPEDAKPVIDGAALDGYKAIAGGLGVWRATLGAGAGGAHTLESAKPVGLQVIGYGAYTSYQYPGGLNLKIIAPPPPPPPATPN